MLCLHIAAYSHICPDLHETVLPSPCMVQAHASACTLACTLAWSVCNSIYACVILCARTIAFALMRACLNGSASVVVIATVEPLRRNRFRFRTSVCNKHSLSKPERTCTCQPFCCLILFSTHRMILSRHFAIQCTSSTIAASSSWAAVTN